MPRKKSEKKSPSKKDESSDSNVEMYENTRNRMLGTSKVIRLMKLWKVPAQLKELQSESEFEVKSSQ